MPVKPDKNSKHIQIILTNGVKWHQTISVVVKNSNVLVQPTNLKYLHITMHPNEGTEKRKNSHLRVSKEDINCFLENGDNLSNNGTLVEWNRKVCDSYDCPLEFIFPNALIHSDKAELIPEYNTKIIEYEKGTLRLNFWFTQHDEETLTKYFSVSGVNVLFFEKIEKTNENFLLTYNISEVVGQFDTIEKTEDYYDIAIEPKESNSDVDTKKLKMMFGLSPEHKKSIIFH